MRLKAVRTATDDTALRQTLIGQLQSDSMGAWLHKASARTGGDISSTNDPTATDPTTAAGSSVGLYYDPKQGRYVTPEDTYVPGTYKPSTTLWASMKTFASDIRQVVMGM